MKSTTYFSSSIYFVTYSYSKFQRYTDTLGSGSCDLYFRTLRPQFNLGSQFSVVMQPQSLPTKFLKAQFKLQYMETKYVWQNPECEVGQNRQGWSSLNQHKKFRRSIYYLSKFLWKTRKCSELCSTRMNPGSQTIISAYVSTTGHASVAKICAKFWQTLSILTSLTWIIHELRTWWELPLLCFSNAVEMTTFKFVTKT